MDCEKVLVVDSWCIKTFSRKLQNFEYFFFCQKRYHMHIHLPFEIRHLKIQHSGKNCTLKKVY